MFENITRKFYFPMGAGDEAADPSDQTPAVEVNSSPKKTRIYANSEEKFLKRVVVYSCSTGLQDPPKMCYDPDGLTPVRPDEAFDLFIKNLMVICHPGQDGPKYYIPSNMIPYNGGYIFTIYDDNGNPISVFSNSNPTT